MNTSTSPAHLIPTQFGTPFAGGFYGGRILVREDVFAFAWAPKALGETKAIWLPSYTDVPNAASSFDSVTNTRAMAEAGSPLAQWALGLEINGFNDWVVPARDVLEQGYRYLKPTEEENACTFRDGDNPSSVPPGWMYTEDNPVQTTVDIFKQGGSEAFDAVYYLTSMQYSANDAFNQNFGSGSQLSNYEKFEARARAVRLIQITD